MDLSGLFQILITLGALIVTYWAAIKGAERGARLSELAMIEHEVRLHAEEHKRQKQQIMAVRLLLALEVRQNVNYLKWLLGEMSKLLGEEPEPFYGQAEAYDDPDVRAWLEARWRFVALYIPEWAHGCWYGQQSSYLASVALSQMEIRELSYHHSQVDRLTKIKNMLTERTLKLDSDGGAGAPPSTLREEVFLLWREFVSLSDAILQRGNPLSNTLEQARVEDEQGAVGGAPLSASAAPAQLDVGPALSLAGRNGPTT